MPSTRRLAVLITAAVAVFAGASTASAETVVSFEAQTAPQAGRWVLPVASDGVLTGAAAATDSASLGAISRAIAAAGFDGAAGATLPLYGLAPFDAVLLVGVGEGPASALDLQAFGGRAAQGVSSWAADAPVRVVAPDVPAVAEDAAHAAYGARLGSTRFNADTLREPPPAPPALVFETPTPDADAARFTSDLSAVAGGVALARTLISTPSNTKSPQWFADEVRRAFAGVPNTRVEVLDEREMARLGMGALLGVGQGSTRPPRLVVVRYTGAGDDAPLAFVGKGITFDTGGISLKDGAGMWRMRYDMSGAAAAVGAVHALAQRGARVNAVAIAALAESMPDGGAIRPGDVLTSMSGKTIEVLNTDAEGRLVLADALWYAQETFQPQLAVTIATLTGSIRTALGDDYGGLFASDDAVRDRVLAAGTASGDLVWAMPVHASVVKELQADVADVRNVVEGGLAGASIGAAFIMKWRQPETPFAHLDIASTAWSTAASPTTPAGATGYGVRLFDELARGYEGR